jgi:hypothetical protein
MLALYFFRLIFFWLLEMAFLKRVAAEELLLRESLKPEVRSTVL